MNGVKAFLTRPFIGLPVYAWLLGVAALGVGVIYFMHAKNTTSTGGANLSSGAPIDDTQPFPYPGPGSGGYNPPITNLPPVPGTIPRGAPVPLPASQPVLGQSIAPTQPPGFQYHGHIITASQEHALELAKLRSEANAKSAPSGGPSMGIIAHALGKSTTNGAAGPSSGIMGNALHPVGTVPVNHPSSIKPGGWRPS